MKNNVMKRLGGLLLLLSATMVAMAQKDSLNELNVSVHMLAHGEMRVGGLGENSTDEKVTENDHASFLMERTRLTLDYKRPGLQTKITAQHSGVWGQKGQGSFNLFEAWAKLSMENGLFAQIGRQALSYDDERIIGPNDWAMAALSHDVLRMGYEGHGHKAHVILGFNQNAENTYGGTYYADGAQPYKIMTTVWYHYDVQKIPLGASLLFMNIGMQAGEKDGIDSKAPHNEFQQLVGGYVSYKPKNWSAEASYYRQMGHNEDGMKIRAWMASIRGTVDLTNNLQVVSGYDYLSGDKRFAVPQEGQIGIIRHEVVKGFNPVYGSHHKFYGMMDFFYVRTYLNGFTPGLQKFYVGGDYSPLENLSLKARYHYMATATKLVDIDMTLGHDIDLEASYQIMKDARFSVGFSYMVGTKTMERLKRAKNNNHLTWGWFSLIISPRIFTARW